MRYETSLRKLRCVLLAFAALYSINSMACAPVAKLIYFSPQDKNLVNVIRADESVAQPKLKLDQLCTGDRVKVSKGGKVSIKYYSNNLPETELLGEAEFPVFPTEIKANTKIGNMLGAVLDIGKWFQQGTQGDMTAYMTTRAPSSSAKAFIRTPLDRGEGAEHPFFLQRDLATIHFFWRGGISPWSVELINKSGNKLLSISTPVPKIVLSLANLNVKEIEAIQIVSSDGKSYVKKLSFENIQSAEHTSDPLKNIVELLYLDAEENWRLQLWSTLQDMKESGIRTTLMDHLEKDDL